MPIFYIILIVLIIFLILSVILNILFNPFAWIVIAALVAASAIRRYLYRKQLEEFNEDFKKRTQEKKQYYYQDRTSHNQTNSEDVIDVDYTIVDEENKE